MQKTSMLYFYVKCIGVSRQSYFFLSFFPSIFKSFKVYATLWTVAVYISARLVYFSRIVDQEVRDIGRADVPVDCVSVSAPFNQ